jgi:threonine synthase
MVANPRWRGLIEEYREWLPVTDTTPVVTLQEGGTPLLPAPVLSLRTGCDVYLKVEGANPTGSFKDRGMTMAISKAVESGSKAVICASTGNTSASAAAYAARAGLLCAVLVPRGKIALGKLAQALVHGAKLLQVDGNFDDCLALASKLAIDYPVTLVNSVNPDRIEGQKTASFEVVDSLGDAPDSHFLPVGNAGNITAYWKGYVEYAEAGKSTKRPKMRGFQAAGSAPIVLGHVVEQPSTIATAIRIGNPASWTKAIGHRPADPVRLPHARDVGGGVRGAGIGGERRRIAPGARARHPRPRSAGRLHGHRQWPQGSGVGDLRSAGARHDPGRRDGRRARPRPDHVTRRNP